jgi:hypothetical protein
MDIIVINFIKEFLNNKNPLINNKDLINLSNLIYNDLSLIKKNTDLFYKNLVYMNLHSYIGNFPIYYQKKLIESVFNKNNEETKKILNNCFSPEFDDNQYLNLEEKNEIYKLIEIEKLAINLYIQNKILNGKYSYDKKFYLECFKQCLNNELSKPTDFINKNIYVFTPEPSFDANVLIMTYLPNIIYFIIKDKINNLTLEKYSNEFKNFIKNRYSTEYKLIKKYIESLKT